MPSKEPRHANLLRLATIGIGLSCLAKGITSRRKRSELEELSVSCDLPGARPDRLRNLKVADFNLSSARAQSERAKLPSGRAKAHDLDWPGLVEEFCRRILRADRNGQPAVDVREFTRPTADDDIEVGGFYLPRRHPTIVFGDGGASKSYTALYLEREHVNLMTGRLLLRAMKTGAPLYVRLSREPVQSLLALHR